MRTAVSTAVFNCELRVCSVDQFQASVISACLHTRPLSKDCAASIWLLPTADVIALQCICTRGSQVPSSPASVTI